MSSEASQEPTVKSDEKSSDHINVRVVSQDGNEVYFKIRKNTPMKKLMAAYCGRQSVSEDAIRFLVNGQRILPDQTPNSLDLEDNDIIDAVLAQTGGGF